MKGRAPALVTLADLVRSGLLGAGDALVMTDREGVEHHAVIRYGDQTEVVGEDDPQLFKDGQMSLFDPENTDDAAEVGQIETLDGSRFDNPTPAAGHVGGDPSVDGWKAWRTVVDGVALEDLQWRFRVRRIPEPDQIAISSWVQFRLSEGADPYKPDEQTINDWLCAQSLAPHDVTAYRSCLHRWFRRSGSDHGSPGPMKQDLDKRYGFGDTG